MVGWKTCGWSTSHATLVGRPTRWSLLFIFGFLIWSSIFPKSNQQRNIVYCYANPKLAYHPITTSHCHPLWMNKSSKHQLQKSWITLQANYPDCCPVYDCEEGTEVVLLFFFTQKIWQTKVTCGQCTLIFNNILHKKIFETKTSENIFMLVKLTSFRFQVVYVTPPSTKKAAKKEGEWGRGGWLRDEKIKGQCLN